MPAGIARDEPRRAGDAPAVREVAYARIPDARRKMLHRQVARALERQGDEVAPIALVEHWRRAGVRARELCYIERAAEQELERGAIAAARLLVQRGLRLSAQLVSPTDVDADLGERRARLERLLATVYWASGDLEATVSVLRRALGHLGFGLPSTPVQWGLAGLRESVRQLDALVWQPGEPPASPGQARRLREALQCGMALFSPLVSRGSYYRAAIVAVMMANLADRLGAEDRCALPYAVLSVVMRKLGLERLAESYATRAHMNLDEDLAAIDFFETTRVFVYMASALGDWPRVEALLSHARAFSERAGDHLSYQSLLVHDACVQLMRDRAEQVDLLVARIAQVEPGSVRRRARQWSRVLGAMAARQAGEPRTALALLDDAGPSDASWFPTARLYGLSTAAACRAHTGQIYAASETAERAVELFDRLAGRHDATVSLYFAYRDIPSALLECAASGELDHANQARALHLARYMVERGRRLTEFVPLARAQWLRNQGLLDAIDGDVLRASNRLSASLAEARRYQLPFEDRLTRRVAASLGRYGRIRTDAV